MLHMRRVQLQFSAEQVAYLEARAAATGASIAAVVRAAVEAQRDTDERRRRIDAALSVVGKYHSGLTDVSERHDDYLAEAIEERLGLK
jgi:hypothetical protein